MSEETSERLAEVEAAARDARDWIVEFIDRVRAGQPLDLEPLTLAHQRLEGLNLGDGEHPYVCGECFAVGPEQHAATCTEGRLHARQHGVDLDGEPVLNQGDEDDLSGEEEDDLSGEEEGDA